MCRRIAYLVIPLSLAIWTITPAPARSMRGNELRVEIQGRGSVPAGYFMQLVDTNNRAVAGSAEADTLGVFSFRSVPAGIYMARLRDSSDNPVRQELIRFDGFAAAIQINLPGLPKRSRPTGERVSVRQLRNPPSKNAIKAFLEARKYSDSGQHGKAARPRWRRPFSFRPHSPMRTPTWARNTCAWAGMRRPLAQRAMEIGSPNINDLCNRGPAEWALGRPADAIRSAEQALRLDSRAIGAHYILGSLMAMNPDKLPEAI